MHRSARAYLTIVLLSLVCSEGCLCETTGVNRGDVNLIGLDEEWAVGEELAQQILQEAPLVDDPDVQAYVEKLGQRLVEETELSGRRWRFYVLADSSVNAFNIPGGHVFVNAGLIASAGNVAELAGVMAHEVAHGVGRHGTERMTKAYGINLIANLVMGEEAGLVEQIAAQIVGSGAIAKFSRDDEREADALGLGYLDAAGYDPAAMAAMFETMLALRQRRPGVVEQFFSTHPLTEERVEAARTAARQRPPKADRILRDDGLARVQERLARLR